MAAAAVTADMINRYGVPELKAYLSQQGVDCADCGTNKAQLRARAMEAFLEDASKQRATGLDVKATVRRLMSLDGIELLTAVFALDGSPAAHLVIAQVHSKRRGTWEQQQPAFQTSGAKHLVEDVHPMFRQGFSALLAKSAKSKGGPQVDVAAFRELNDNLHAHHSGEDRCVGRNNARV